jgi:serine/threonine-protein kinase Chk2
MLTVDVESRITIDGCLEHPWLTQKVWNPADSTDGLTGAMHQLDFSKRKMARERTLLSSINDVKVSKVIETEKDKASVKVWEKNANETRKANKSTEANLNAKAAKKKEEVPDTRRDTAEFMEMGGKGDQVLFDGNGESRYAVDDNLAQVGRAE